jgi:anti-anti-sigma regulatory factor
MDKWLAERRDALAEHLAQGLRDRIAHYRDISDEGLRPAARAFIDHFISALRTGDLAPLLDAGTRNLERRFGQGLSVEAGMQFTEPLRDAFFLVLRPAFEEQLSGVYDVILAANRIFDQLDKIAVQFIMSELKKDEKAIDQSARQEEHIRAQEQMLRELSTPLIPVGEDVVVMPLIGALNEARAEQMRCVLLEGIATNRARVAIIDVTGVPNVDAEVGEALVGAVRSARLLGADVVVTGIQPAAAQAFINIGADFSGIVTKSTLKHGIAHALTKAR